MFQFGSAVPLGIFAATAYARQLRLCVGVPGPGIGFFGGVTASVFLMLSALLAWVLSRPEVTTDVTLTHALAFLAFISGGAGFVFGLGLLAAGIAVPVLIPRFIPRWLAWTGLILAAGSELNFFSMVIEPMQFLLPVGRFGGLLWLASVVSCFRRRGVRPMDRTADIHEGMPLFPLLGDGGNLLKFLQGCSVNHVKMFSYELRGKLLVSVEESVNELDVHPLHFPDIVPARIDHGDDQA